MVESMPNVVESAPVNAAEIEASEPANAAEPGLVESNAAESSAAECAAALIKTHSCKCNKATADVPPLMWQQTWLCMQLQGWLEWW